MIEFREFLLEQFYRPDSKLNSDSGYLYHATNVDNLEGIMSSGSLSTFSPSHGTDQDVWPDGSTQNRSYWTDKASTAWHFAPEEGSPVILRTRTSPLFKREITGDYYAERPIPSSLLEIKMKDGLWVPISSVRL